MKRLPFVVLVLLVALLACEVATETPTVIPATETGTMPATETETLTPTSPPATQTATETETPTVSPTATETQTPGPTYPPPLFGVNVAPNPDYEYQEMATGRYGRYLSDLDPLGGVFVAWGNTPVWSGECIKFPHFEIETHPPNTYEYTITGEWDITKHSGRSFTSYDRCWHGHSIVVDTVPGYEYAASVWVKAISEHPAEPPRSEVQGTMVLVVDKTGTGDNFFMGDAPHDPGQAAAMAWFAPGLLMSGPVHDYGRYVFRQLKVSFTATSEHTLLAALYRVDYPIFRSDFFVDHWEVYATEPVALSEHEETSLAALCWVETRNLGDQRVGACASVISTVLARMAYDKMTDGSIIGTIRWGCDADDLECQFPAYVTRACEEDRNSCPFDDRAGMAFYRAVVKSVIAGNVQPACRGYLYYGIKDFDTPECQIKNGAAFLNFHNGRMGLKPVSSDR